MATPLKTLAVTLLLGCALALGAVAVPGAGSARAATPRTNFQLFTKECSACHMAFPAQFLPTRSWRAIMGRLGHHFGEDASLDPATVTKILAYLVTHAADTPNGRFEALSGLPSNVTPLRITDTPSWRQHHRGLLATGRITLGPGPHMASNCVACHRRGFHGGEGGGDH